jgi:hypothetical protein
MGRDRSDINMSGIPVAGVGGLGLVAVALVMTTFYPQAWWLLAIGAIGGALAAVALIWYRRHHREAGPSGHDPMILFRPEPPAQRTRARDEVGPRHDLEQLIASGTVR